MSETVSPKPSAQDVPNGPNGPPNENAVTSQPENGAVSQITAYPTPKSQPNSAVAQPQPSESQNQKPEQQPTPQNHVEPPYTSSAAQPPSQVPPNLPPIHAVDRPAETVQVQPPQQPPQSQHVPQRPQVPMGQPMPANPSPVPQMASMNQFYSTSPPNMPPHDQMNISTMQVAGYQGEQNKLLSGGRHKKEVKRRTKTGCLTCRKRRIKCDETHPVCRNCVKSKRECLGYDPVFRTQPPPSAIQPAPNPPPSLVVAPQNPSSYPNIPPGYVAAAAPPPFVPSLPSESPTPSLEQPDYRTSTDPSQPPHNSPPAPPPTQNNTEGNLQPQAAPVPPPPADPATMPQPLGQKVKKLNAHDLLSLDGIPPPPKFPIAPLQPDRSSQVSAVSAMYCSGADRFLETHWFQEKGLPMLEGDPQQRAQFSGLIDTLSDPQPTDPIERGKASSLDASMVWTVLELCRVDEGGVASPGGTVPPASPARLVALSRQRVVEALITGDHFESNPATMPDSVFFEDASQFSNQLRQREYQFWSSLGYILTLRDGEGNATEQIDAALATCRSLLDTYENRDVLYSIAIARIVGHRWAELPATATHLANGETRQEAAHKLYIAQRFLEDEAAGKSAIPAIKRVCGMVIRSWTLSRE
ncbi:hypothetical protein FQN54_005753 [Arachnomyces sp. PD_36]|nr:hypothetical protein FQN54_005753 [Arachnomyces sp. PD_36]